MNHYKSFLLSLLLSLIMGQHACAESITITGSTTVQKYMNIAASAYHAKHPDIHFNITGGGSTSGFAQITDERVDMGMMSREPSATEAHELALNHIQSIAIALDAVVPVVSPEVYQAGVKQITPQQLAGIYQGTINNWQQLGGADRQIMVVDKNIYHGTRSVFAKYVLGSNTAPNPSISIILDSDDDILQLLQSSDQAIAYIGIGFISPKVRALNLNIQHHVVTASYASIRNAHYPMARKLYILVAQKSSANIQDFVTFILSQQGQQLIDHAGYLPLGKH